MKEEQGKPNVRQLALTMAERIERGGQYSNLALDACLKQVALSGADRALLTTLTYGVIERRITLDYTIDALSSLPPSKIERQTRGILRQALYEVTYLDRIPEHAAVSEAVSLASPRAKGFVNALLRTYIRRGRTPLLPDRDEDLFRYLSVAYSFPAETCELFVRLFGGDRCERLLALFNREPSPVLRTNTQKIGRDALIARLTEAGFAAEATSYSPWGIRLAKSVPLASLPGDDEGLWFVQDEASQIAAAALGVTPGDTVLDVCACPGGKSFSLALAMQDTGSVLASDLHANKVSLIERGAGRLGLASVQTAVRDARTLCPALVGQADAVLCDVPCSGFGVFAKKPDIRYKRLADIAGLPAIQHAILNTCSAYVRPGGVLVYATCTLLPAENDDQAEAFLREHPEFTAEDFTVGALSSANGRLTLMPDTHGTDGFFVAKFRRQG